MARRNANGEGSVYKRKDGRWEGAIWLPTTSGKRKRVRTYGTTRKEAWDKLTELAHQANQGHPVADKSWRLRLVP